MRIGLCLIATGKYVRFLPGLLDSARRYFLAGHDVHVFVFSDHDDLRQLSFAIHHYPCPHEPWPGPTLNRYRTMLRAERELLDCDYVFYLDVDSRFVRPVGDEILSDLVAVIHPGFSAQPRCSFTYETRPQSAACVFPNEGERYYAGGFQGGRAAEYLSAMRAMRDNIEADAARGVTAVWHDESHWNRYLIDHPPTAELSPLYCSPDSWNVPGRKLVALDKNHAEIRR